MAQTNTEVAERWLAAADIAPPFKVAKSKAAFERQRREVRARAWQLLGDRPKRPKVPAVQVLSSEERADYRLEKFQFENGAGAVVPGYLLVPRSMRGKAPAILYCHWHGGEYDIGKEELFQSRHTPEAPGPTLVKRGYVVMGIDAYCFGERNGQGPSAERGRDGELTASKFQLWAGRTLWGMMLHDDLLALDYLASRKEVDSRRLGAMGMSMGATRAWWLMALDDRIQTAVPIACVTRYQNLIRHGLLKAHGIYYYVPDVLKYFDTEAIVACIAPRPVLFMTGDSDGTSPVDGIRDIEAAVRPAYALYGKPDNFQNVIYPNQGHVYTPEMWQRTLAWLDDQLKQP